MRHVQLKLAGFNPASGAIIWTLPVSDVTSLSFGNGISFLNGTDVAVRLMNNKSVLLNTTTGATTPLSNGLTLWCEKMPSYKVSVPKGSAGRAERISEPLYYPCTSHGETSTKLPAAFPSSVGTTIDGVFIWPSPTGLRTHTVGQPQTAT